MGYVLVIVLTFNTTITTSVIDGFKNIESCSKAAQTIQEAHLASYGAKTVCMYKGAV